MPAHADSGTGRGYRGGGAVPGGVQLAAAFGFGATVQQLGSQSAAAMKAGRPPKARGGAGHGPGFIPRAVAMLLCNVALGRVGNGGPSMRRPPPSCDSSTGGAIFAVYSNDQAYPAYVVHYK